MRSFWILGLMASVRLAAADDSGKADALFEEGQQLRAAGKVAEACQKFEGALALNPNAVGLILNVALCDEDTGKVATAARLYKEARDRASESKLEEHRKAAAEHLAKVEPRVPHLAITFAEAPGPDTKLVVDDRIVPVLAASDVAVDPGERTVVVTAPGRVPFETRLKLAEGAHESLEIPKLGYPVTIKKSTLVTTGKVMVLGGAGLAIAGEVFGLYGRHLWHSVVDPGICKPAASDGMLTCDTADAQSTADRGRTYGNIGTGVGIAGLAIAGVGAGLWLFGPRQTEKLAIVPTIGGVTAIGHF